VIALRACPEGSVQACQGKGDWTVGDGSCICAGHMEEDVAGARKRQAGFKNERGRRKRWLARAAANIGVRKSVPKPNGGFISWFILV
jgi:hypothetical protein